MIEFWDVNWWVIIVATFAMFVIGMLWYGPVFGKTWFKLTGFNPEEKPKNAGTKMLINFFSNFVLVWAVAVLVSNFGITTFGMSLCLASFVWGAIELVSSTGSVLWEKYSAKLFAFNMSYSLVSLIIITLILSNWQ
jgi:hypothetical protein